MKNLKIRVYVVKDFITLGKRIEILTLPDFDIKNIPEVSKDNWTLQEIKYVTNDSFYFEDNNGSIPTLIKKQGYYIYDATIKFGE